jgi:hypothetical protein
VARQRVESHGINGAGDLLADELAEAPEPADQGGAPGL